MSEIALLTPDWPAPPGVHALFTLRGQGAGEGASRGAHGAFNLGDHVGDEPAAVQANRARLTEQLQARPVFLRQVHGSQAIELDAGTPDGASADAATKPKPKTGQESEDDLMDLIKGGH